MSGFTLIVVQQNKVYNFKGSQLWKVDEQVRFYRLFSESFPFNDDLP